MTAALIAAPATADAYQCKWHPRCLHRYHVHHPRVRPVSAVLQRIARCESGGNPRAVDPSGTYRGKYQFDIATWASVGGNGDPAAAPESEQDRRATRLYRERGWHPWPNCGRR